jgi:glutathione S-transferase
MCTHYHAMHSQHSRRVISLLEQVDMQNGDYLSDWYRAINLNHRMPFFVTFV